MGQSATPEHEAALIEAVWKGWGRKVERLEPVRLGYDAEARTYRAQVAGGELFLKTKPRLEAGISLSLVLRTQGIEEVLPPLLTLQGDLGQSVNEGWLLAYPFLEGANGFQQRLTLDQWRRFGRATRQMHDSVLPPEVSARIERERFEADGYAELVNLSLPPVTPATEALASLFQRHRAEIDRILLGVREFGEACRERSWAFVPCHADLHVGNLLLLPVGNLRIIDWDAPRLAPRERDLMFVMDGGILAGHGPEEEAAFFLGYGEANPDALALTYYRFAWATSDIAAYTAEASAPAFDDPSEGMKAVAMLEEIFTPGGIVASAFRSEDRLSRIA